MKPPPETGGAGGLGGSGEHRCICRHKGKLLGFLMVWASKTQVKLDLIQLFNHSV